MNRKTPFHVRAFTLSEIMAVVGIFGFVMAGLMPFFIMNLKSQFVGEQKLLINGDIRKLTNQMVENARESNNFVIYQSFTAQNRFDGLSITRDANGNGSVTSADQMLHGQSGEFLVLIYYDDPYLATLLYDGNLGNWGVEGATPLVNGKITRLVGYWTAPNRRINGEYAIYSFDTDAYKSSSSATSCTTSWGKTFPVLLSTSVTLESLLPPATTAYSQAAEFPILVNNLNGLSNGYCFYNYQNKSIITRAKILHGNKAKRTTNTYNFTITPRG